MQTEKQRERLVELLSNCQHEYDKEVISACAENRPFKRENCFYADYLMSNNVVVLPCKVGDTAYYVFDVFEEVCKGRIIEIRINLFTEPKIWISVEYDSKFIGRQVCSGNEMIGKTVFLSREEAENVLK